MTDTAATPDTSPAEETDEFESLEDFIAQRIYGYNTYENAVRAERTEIRLFVRDFFNLADGVTGLAASMERDGYDALPRSVKNVLRHLSNPEDGTFAEELLIEYTRLMYTYVEGDVFPFEMDKAQYVELRGMQILEFVNRARELMMEELQAQAPPVTEYDLIEQALGPDFSPQIDHLTTAALMRKELLDRPGKFRPDNSPQDIKVWECRIGGSKFLVPPININVSQQFHTESLSGGAIRQSSSPKTNLGHSDVDISMTLLFPNHESIWGFRGDQFDVDLFNWDPEPYKIYNPVLGGTQVAGTTISDQVIDYYLSSLRGLITQFKYSPILPVRNIYLNKTYGISAVTMNNLTVSTLEGFPFVVQVTLNMKKFNFQPYLPMIQDFEQAIHWGRFRQFMGRAAAALDAKVNEGFLQEVQVPENLPQSEQYILQPDRTKDTYTVHYPAIPIFNKIADINKGKHFELFYPKTTPSRIYAPDTTDFRQEGEDLTVTEDVWDGFLSSIGLDLVNAPEFNFFEFSNARRRISSERQLITDWLRGQNINFTQMNNTEYEKFVEAQVAQYREDGVIQSEAEEDYYREKLRAEWYYMVFNGLVGSSEEIKKIKANLEDSQDYKIKEWEVPMEKLFIDWPNCLIQGVTVTLANNFAPFQFNGQENPTFQHIGGGDSTVSVNMIVLGEENIMRLQSMFRHINGLARLEQGHGVLGFLGIKNLITAMCGVKYVLPLSFESQTIPNYPHAYNVQMSFVDFDIMQQKREELNNEQQFQLKEIFGKRNPFLRLKQLWSAFNGYPDMPLDVKDEAGTLLGYMDPDWYFRSFISREDDTINWGIDPKVQGLVTQFNSYTTYLQQLEAIQDTFPAIFSHIFDNKIKKIKESLSTVEADLNRIYDETGYLMPGYTIQNGHVVFNATDGQGQPIESNGPVEHTQYLGVYGKDNEISAKIDFYKGAYFSLSTENLKDGKKSTAIGMGCFNEDLASQVCKEQGVRVEGTVGGDVFQKEYIEGETSPNRQYESVMQDFQYRNLKGRMLRAFPTYMLWLIDEGGRFAGIKLFDNFYGLNSVIDFAVHTSEDCIEDTLVLTLSNIYEKLTTPFNDTLIPEDSPIWETPIGQWITTAENRARNTVQGMSNELLELNNIRLKPGVRVHLRAGYGSNPNNLQTLFNGTVAEVQQGQIMTVVCQSDAVELTGMVNTSDTKGDTGKMVGGIGGLWMAEPRDLIVRLLSMGSTVFKEWVSWATKGVIFSESKFGIRHFGNIIYEPLTSREQQAHDRVKGGVWRATLTPSDDVGQASFQGLAGDKLSEVSKMEGITSMPGQVLDANLFKIAQFMWTNSFTNRDYELFKRNVYPGNGTGIAQFMGGDMIDGGLLMTQVAAAVEAERADGTQATGAASDVGEEVDPNSAPPTQAERDVQAAIADTQYQSDHAFIDELWNEYKEGSGFANSQELIDALGEPSMANLDFSKIRNNEGLVEDLLQADAVRLSGLGGAIFPYVNGQPFGLASTLFAEGPGRALGFQHTVDPNEPTAAGGGAMGAAADVVGFLGNTQGLGLATTAWKTAYSPVGQVLGMTPVSHNDDDIGGFDEVSFRAQTYMKTVWDMFKICAALLPNYIIAIRPFEERSTVFYGKPHWMYTSGVIPITTGIPKGNNNAPFIEDPNKELGDILESFRSSSSPEATLNRILDDSGMLKDIMEFGGPADPYDVGGADGWTNPEAQAIVDAFIAKDVTEDRTFADHEDLSDATLLMIKNFLLGKVGYLEQFDNDVIDEILRKLMDVTYAADEWVDMVNSLEDFTERWEWTIEQVDPEQGRMSGEDLIEEWISDDTDEGEERFEEQLGHWEDVPSSLLRAAETDPITFAYQFGWKFSMVPIFISPGDGFGYDQVGDLARRRYDDKYDPAVEGLQDGNDAYDEAVDIWRDFRTKAMREDDQWLTVYNKVFPLDNAANFETTLDLFYRYLWQDPYNRAWISAVMARERDDPGDILGGAVDELSGALGSGNPNGRTWDFHIVTGDPEKPDNEGLWEIFLRGELTVHPETNAITNAEARAWMQRNQRAGTRAGNFVTGWIEDGKAWVDENLGQLLAVVGDTLTGFISSIRMSLSQMGNALSMSGDMQKQANILNSVFDDSIYFQAGPPGSLRFLIDNPFTREYGEPVVEIREPFQRIHFVSSFDSILHNGIRENLNNVPTVVTAVSDGKYPVRVHLDKGIPPERQVEKIVETGILWDNAYGAGVFGFFHPLLHPFETVRGYSKALLGSSDQLSSRRVALSHLKEGLKDIYTGELILMGDPDIRPFDLLYIADITERMYGMCEVESVRHDFSPTTGFTTHVTPNAVVTVNDPARWTMLSYMWSKMTSYNIRDDVKASLAISVDRSVSTDSREIREEDVYKYFGPQIDGAVQYTQGNSGLIKDIGAVFTGNGVDDLWNQVAKMDIMIGAGKGVATVAGAGIGTLIAPGVGTAIGAAGGFVLGDLMWEAWGWVKDNLLDQHGCYIQFLNKGGQPMDAGLSHYQGLAVGSNHTVDLFPNILGVPTPAATAMVDGHYRITTNDLLGALGWTEVDVLSLQRETSLFVQKINSQILTLAGRDPDPVDVESNVEVIKGRVTHVVDGDTIEMTVFRSTTKLGDDNVSTGESIKIRFAGINTAELLYEEDAQGNYLGDPYNDPNDLATAAVNYLRTRFSNIGDITDVTNQVAVRVDKQNAQDDYDRYIGVVFANVPVGTPNSDRLDTLTALAERQPIIPWDAFMEDGRPYTLNWEMIMTGYGNVEMRESIWDTSWRDQALTTRSGE